MRRGAARIAQRQLVGRVVEDDAHAEVLGQDGELGADVAVADDAQRATADLVRAVGRLVPDAGVHALVLLGQPAGQRDELGNGQLDDAAGIGERCVEDGDTALGGRGQVDLVRADAERAHGEQILTRVHGPRRQLGLGAQAQQVHPGQPGDQLVLVQGAVDRLDLDPGQGQHGDRVGMDLLEQQRT